ncbi:hypothetical protein EDC01DRAFT_654152 [Geopyxis carbonaria]|nr:hypothetical protein EDC01DRAFT_654152 [Geopyxis carbonaria]
MAHYRFLLAPMGDNETHPGDAWNPRGEKQRDLVQQLLISVLLGLGAFTTFCILRPRFPQFYYARKIRIHRASSLPDLPPSLFGWIPALWRVTDQEVLATAGLDAYVFLAFFKMAIKFLVAASVLAAVVLAPIHAHFHTEPKDKSLHEIPKLVSSQMLFSGKNPKALPQDKSYLWAHVIFVYVFTSLVFYFLLDQTQEVVQIRQNYLGNQATVTDRTIKLSGIPEELRSEGILKEYIEKLKIGKVESITICRKWQELDRLMEERQNTLRKLEEAHTAHHSHPKINGDAGSGPDLAHNNTPGMTPDEEAMPLLGGDAGGHFDSSRPRLTLRKGWFKLSSKKVDAINFLTNKLQDLDDKITEARRKEYSAMPLAFITMDSVPAAQVAIQALLDPTPGAMIARQAPSPSDIVWPNTYLSRTSRSFRGWAISISVTLLSIFWLVPVTALAALWDLHQIRQISPGVADFLEDHEVLGSLVQTFLPTLVLTLLNVAIPYLYDWLSNYQGLISQSEVELSVIGKNFFFTFFNLFLAFTISGTAFKTQALWDTLRDISDTQKIATLLAKAVQDLGPFYINLIVLQGLGMFPLRLLQIGSVTLYPVTKFGAKTPRDYAELVQPTMFKYGFYLPQPILIYIVCIVYSVLEDGFTILVFGLLYFILGYFTYKYQLLYAMDHPRHSTGGAWPMIVYRVILGLLVFQLTMAGWLSLAGAYTRAALITPLIAFTGWSVWHYNKHYKPSNYFIALKSVRHTQPDSVQSPDTAQTIDEEREEGLEFVNPSLSSPLENVWVTRITGDLAPVGVDIL